MTSRCGFCNRLVDHGHHNTGRPEPGAPYFDPLLTVGLCRAHHVVEHVALRRADLEWPGDRDPLAFRLLRVADHLRRLADAGRGLVLSPTATAALAALLLAAAAVLGRRRRRRHQRETEGVT